MLNAIQIHYQPDMLGLATDNHAYGSVQLAPKEQAEELWRLKQDELGWSVWDGFLNVEESARLFDDIEITQLLDGVCWLDGREVAVTTPQPQREGLLRIAPEGSVRAEYPLQSRWKGVTHCPCQRLAHKRWDANAFIQGSLPWNLQTLLCCQCARNGYTIPFFLDDENVEGRWLYDE